MRNLKHNKRRNLGLVYEFLTREVSDAVVSEDRNRAATALAIVAEHLAEGTPLYEELSLHRQVMSSRGVSEKFARRVVDELRAAGMRLSTRSVIRERAKSDLIHEMNRKLGRDIFDRYRIPDYTAHASVNIIMSRGLGARVDESIEAAKVEEHLTAFLQTKQAEVVRYDDDTSMFAYRTAVKIFKEEFGAELDASQASLIKEYVKVSLGGNVAPFEKTFKKQREELVTKLSSFRTDEVFRTDADMAKRLDEAINELRSLTTSGGDEAVEKLVTFHNLRREIES